MGDSDEEYDRRRRDKFRGERNDYDNNRRPPPRSYDRGRGADRVRSGHDNNAWENKGAKRDYYGHERKDNFGGGGRNSPPGKRRREWEEPQAAWRGGDSNALAVDKGATPPLMGFKEFIMKQEDDIEENEAVRRYQEYKVEYRRTQINDFFVLHKDKEWFREKYHPEDSVERKKNVRNGIRRRLKIFLDLVDAGYIDNISLSIEATPDVLKFLDRVLIKLEGGSDEEVKALDLPPVEEEPPKKEEVKKEEDPSMKKEEEMEEPLPPGMEDEDEPQIPGVDEDEPMEEKPTEEDLEKVKEEGENCETKVKAEEVQEDKAYIYTGTHLKRPVSLFMRNIPPSVSRQDLITVCEKYPGYLRIALSEPSPERRWARRAWATFEPSVNVKDICWNLSNIRIKECELSPVVNREVTHRIRPVNGITAALMTMEQDAKYIAALIRSLDKRYRLYEKDDVTTNNGAEDVKKEEDKEEVKKEDTNTAAEPKTEEEEDGEEGKVKEEGENGEEEKEIPEVIELPSENPLLTKLPPEIEEVEPIDVIDEEEAKIEQPLTFNDDLAKQLDHLILYLRVVHCVDYYNANEYLHEDEMPVRCGIFHVRDKPIEAASKKDVEDWFSSIKSKLNHILIEDGKVTDKEADKLGKKNEETEVENFIKANTQEVTPEKWLCPLSGKKFRGPDYIRKHIMMKHLPTVENVKIEVKFFNNYVYDYKRPCFPDPRLRQSSNSFTPNNNRQWVAPRNNNFNTPRGMPPNQMFSTPQPSQQPETYGRMSTYPPKPRRAGGYKDRKIIKYRDLDAPDESDFF